MKMNRHKIRNSILLFLAAFIWGTAFVAQSVGMNYVGPFTFTFSRSILASLFLFPIILLLDKGKRARGVKTMPGTKKDLVVGGICCGLALFISSSLQQIGIMYTTVGRSGFITALYIVIVPLLGIFIGKRVRIFVWISVVLSVIGLYLLCMKDSFALGKGEILVLLCAIGFSFHILIIDYFVQKADGVKMSCIQFLVCGILGLLFTLLFEHPDMKQLLSAWLPVCYAGIMSSGVAYTLQIVGQKDMDPTVSSLIMSLESVVSAISGFVILHQVLSLRELSGCILMFGAVILAQISDPLWNWIQKKGARHH